MRQQTRLILILSAIAISSSYIKTKVLHPPTRSDFSASQIRASITYNAFEDESNLELLEKVRKSPPKSIISYEEKQFYDTTLAADVSTADIYWESTLPRTKKRRQAAAQEADTLKRINVDKSFYNLMDAGFQRRLSKELADIDYDQPVTPSIAKLLPKIAASKTSDQLELRKSKEEQLKELKRRQMMKRSGIMKLVPQSLHKYFDYLMTLRKDPAKGDMTRNIVVGTIFSFITLSNARVRMAFLYAFLGNVAVMSILLTRNMPKLDVPPGMDRRRVVNWSDSSFKSAVAITLLFAVPTGLLAMLLCSLTPLPTIMKARLSLAASIMGSAYFTAFYEVFEEKTKNGWRWKKAMEGSLDDDVTERLRKQVYSKEDSSDLYDFNYDPQIDEYPPQPKYIDERDALVLGKGVPQQQGGAGDVDETESAEHFANWREQRKDSRKAPILEVEPETPWVGGKKGMYVQNIPTWLTNAYQANVLKANKWRGKPTKFVKDTSEFEPIEGPVGFRDKRVEWLDLFGSGIWEEKITASRKAARAFGSYRKTMWKIDKEVELQPCDGADK